jgi:hypothetical protein
LLSEICDTLLDPWDPESHDEGYQGRLKALEYNINSLPVSALTSSTTSAELSAADLQEIYQMTTLIYLARASQSPWEPSTTELDSVIDRAFAVPTRGHSCDHFFPLLILACEARTDEQRAMILDVIDRTEKTAYTRSMEDVKALVRSFWVQQDLYADDDLVLNYLGLMKAVISSNSALPSFV